VVARIVVVGRCGNKEIAVAAVVSLVSITAVACCGKIAVIVVVVF
jgi:hypothetical protein